MNECETNFFELFRYVKYIRDNKVKFQCLLSGLLQYYEDIIESYDPLTLLDKIINAK